MENLLLHSDCLLHGMYEQDYQVVLGDSIDMRDSNNGL